MSGQTSILLIGKNGSGKTTVGLALQVLQRIARGTNRVGDLVSPTDIGLSRTDAPVRFEIEVELGNHVYQYGLAFELPTGFKELRVIEENLVVNGQSIYSRNLADVHLARAGQQSAEFRIDWHLVALPIIQLQRNDELSIFKQWLARMLILRPTPSAISGDSKDETLQPNVEVTNFGAWYSGVLSQALSAYATIDQYLKQVMPDLKDIKNPQVGKDSRTLEVHFAKNEKSIKIAFEDLSDGEKSFMIGALVLALNDVDGPVLCFWDEPDNHLDLSEVGHFVTALRKGFQSGGQFIATSHNAEAIRRFSDQNTLVVSRKSHVEPTIVRPIQQLNVNGDLIAALIRGDVEL